MNGEKKEVLQYVGTFIGSQPKKSGVKPDGTPWQMYDIMFHHGDMTKPVRFTWFNNIVDGAGNQLIPNTIYRVMYNMNEFPLKDGSGMGKSKTAFKIVLSSGEQLGFQQQQAVQGQPNQSVTSQPQVAQQPMPQPSYPQQQQQGMYPQQQPMQQPQPIGQPHMPPQQVNPNALTPEEIEFMKDYMNNSYPGDRKYTDPSVLAGYYLSKNKPQVYARFILIAKMIETGGR